MVVLSVIVYVWNYAAAFQSVVTSAEYSHPRTVSPVRASAILKNVPVYSIYPGHHSDRNTLLQTLDTRQCIWQTNLIHLFHIFYSDIQHPLQMHYIELE